MEERRPLPDWFRLVIIWIVTVLLVAFCYLLFVARNLEAITAIDALDYAQISRNLADGKGYTTDFIKPLSLTRVPSLDPQPELVFPPLHPLFMAPFIKVLGAGKNAVALASGLPFLATLLLTYLLGLRLFDRRAAILGTALFGLNLWALSYSISGLEVCLLGLIFMGLLLVLHAYGQDERRRVWLAVAAGALVGLLGLTKEIWAVALLPVGFYLAYWVGRPGRVKMVGVMLGAFLVVMLPWWVRQAVLVGNPFFTWRWYEITMMTMTNPGNTLYRSYTPSLVSPLTFMIYHPGEMLQKIRTGADMLYPVLLALGGPFVAAFFIVGIMVPLGSAVFERMRYLVYWIYGLLVLLLVLVLPDQRALYPLAPIVALTGAAFFLRILVPLVRNYGPREQYRYTTWAIAAFVVLQAFPLLANLTAQQRPGERSMAARAEQLAQEVSNLTTGPIVTDVPWWTAWYGKQKSIWLPRSWEDMERLQQDIGQIRYVVLTPMVQQTESTERT